MTCEFYAQPYGLSASGFYFRDYKSFLAKSRNLKNDYGQTVEEFEIQFIDGERKDAELFKALGIHQGNIGTFIDKAEEWEDWEKINIILAVGEAGYDFDMVEDDPGDLDIDIYQVESLKELAEQFVDEGLFGDIPENIAPYLDMDAIARDLSYDYCEVYVAGETFVYRCG